MERFFAGLMRRGGKVAAIIELGRPWNAISVALLSVIGAMLAATAIVSMNLLLIVAVETFLIYMAASILNDIYDLKVDKINMPYRPLEMGKISINTAYKFCIAFYIVGIIISFFVSVNFFVAILLMSLLSIMYSVPPIAAKNRGFLGNIVLGVDMIFISMYAGYVIVMNSLMPGFQFLTAVLLFTVSFILINVVKDFKDIYGDRLYGKKTAAVRYSKGVLISMITIGTFILLPSLILFNTYFFQSVVFLWISVILFISLLANVVILYLKLSVEVGELAWGIERALMLILILVMFSFSIVTFT